MTSNMALKIAVIKFMELKREQPNLTLDEPIVRQIVRESISNALRQQHEEIKSDDEEESDEEEDDEEFNEECEECGAKMYLTKLTEEEFDEHPDREAWFCMKCRDFDEAGRYKPYFEEGRDKLIDEFNKKYGEEESEED